MKENLIGLGWAFLFFILRNFFFQFADVWLLISSMAIGLLIYMLLKKVWQIWAFVGLALPLADWPSVYLLSLIPAICTFCIRKFYRLWRFYFLLGLIPLLLIATWMIDLERFSHDLGAKANLNIELRRIENTNPYLMHSDTVYFLSYWHLSCKTCLIQDKNLFVFEYQNHHKPLKVISVFMGDSSDWRFAPSLALYHRHFPNCIDVNASLENSFDQKIGPALLIVKNNKALKLWHGYYHGPLRDRFQRWYWSRFLQ